MAWQTELVEIVRVLTDDLDGPYRLSDAKLVRVLCVAAFQVAREVDFSQTFSVDVSAQSISPDPTLDATKEESFSNLVCLKAACILDRGQAVTAARRCFSVRDGGSSFDNTAQVKAKLALLEKGGWCASYADAKLEYEAGQVRVAGACVMSPFRLYAHGHRGCGADHYQIPTG